MVLRCRILPMEDLNTSDHLPLLADMMYAPVAEEDPHAMPTRTDWRQAISSGDIDIYRETVSKHVNHLASNSYDCVEEVEKELNYVGKLLCDTALRTLPCVQHPSRQRWKDSTLNTLCSI